MKRALWLCLFTAFGSMCWSQEQIQPTKTPVLRLTLLGTGGPAPRVERFGPSTLVQAGDKLFLFDCGRGAAQRLFQLGVLRDANALFLTHLHSDHVVGIPDLWLTGWFEGRTTSLQVWGPTGTRDMMSHLREAYQFDIDIRSQAPEHVPAGGIAVTAKDIGEGTVYDDGAIKIEAFNVDHGPVKPALGYRVHYAGHSVVISGDTRPSENLVRFAKGANVLIHCAIVVSEARRNSERARAALQLLATAEEAGQVFDRVKPKLALYTHYNTADDLVARTRKAYSGPLEVGEDLLTVEIGDQIHVQKWLGQEKRTDPPSQAEQEVLRLEEERRQAILHNDAAAMDRLLAEEFIVTDNEGRTHDRADELSLYKNKRRQTQSWEASDLKVYVYGDSAVVNERVALKDILDGRMRNTEFRLTDFWVKQDGRWQLAARHGTPIAQPELLQARQALSDDTAIRKHVSDYVDAYNAHDPEKMSALFTDDQDTVVLPGRLLKGKPALRELFIRRHSSIAKNSHLSRTVENIRFIKPDLAVVDGTYDATGMSDEKGNPAPALRAWVTEILIKTDNQWRGVVFRAIPLAGVQSAPVSTRSSGEAAGRLERNAESEAEARKVIAVFSEANNKRDLEGLRNALNFPFVRIASGKVNIARTREEFTSDWPPGATAQGWHHSAVDSVEFIQSGTDKVHAAVVFSRYKADGTRYATYQTLRIITKQDGHWGIQCSSSFAP